MENSTLMKFFRIPCEEGIIFSASGAGKMEYPDVKE